MEYQGEVKSNLFGWGNNDSEEGVFTTSSTDKEKTGTGTAGFWSALSAMGSTALGSALNKPVSTTNVTNNSTTSNETSSSNTGLFIGIGVVVVLIVVTIVVIVIKKK